MRRMHTSNPISITGDASALIAANVRAEAQQPKPQAYTFDHPFVNTGSTPFVKFLHPGGGQAPSGYSQTDSVLEREFHSLVMRWNDETCAISSLTKIYAHPAYQRIIAMGISGVPLVLKELDRNQGRWFYALKFMAGKDISEGMSNFDNARAAWLHWGHANHYI